MFLVDFLKIFNYNPLGQYEEAISNNIGLNASFQEFMHVYTVPMHSQTLHKRPSDVYSVCECIGTVYTCMDSWTFM